MSDELRASLFEECFELVEETGKGLRAIADGSVGDFDETIGAAFRAVHSIKGGAASFALNELSGFAKRFEAVLRAARDGQLALEPEVMELLLSASDALADRLRADEAGATPDVERESAIYADLGALIGAEDGDGADDGAALSGFQPMSLDFELGGQADAAPLALDIDLFDVGGDPATGPIVIHLAADANLYRRGSDATKLLRALATIGAIEVDCDASGTPAFAALDPEQPSLRWRIVLEETADEDEVHEVFEFFEDDVELRIGREAPQGTPETAATIG